MVSLCNQLTEFFQFGMTFSECELIEILIGWSLPLPVREFGFRPSVQGVLTFSGPFKQVLLNIEGLGVRWMRPRVSTVTLQPAHLHVVPQRQFNGLPDDALPQTC